MPIDYFVKQGDYLAKLAKQFGLPVNVIWNHAKNAELKQKRPNPNVLFPGDRLYIPDLKSRDESCPTDRSHKFETSFSKLRLRLVLEDKYERPIANAKCVLGIGSDFQYLTTDDNGRIDKIIPPDAEEGFVLIQDPETPERDVRISLKIGHLDPIDEVSGQTARLNNLGYFAGDIHQPDEDAFLSAVEEFQCDFELQVDGICGPNTQAKLKQVHGC
jgi:Putative peptidoglycan binding domain/LysM domain